MIKDTAFSLFIGIALFIALYFILSPYRYLQIIDSSEILKLFPLQSARDLSILDDPIQATINPEQKSFQFSDFILTPVATYQIKAHVLSANRHYNTSYDKALSSFMDPRIFPIDIAMGWGLMSDPEKLRHVKVTQHGRWDFWQPIDNTITNTEVMLHSDNFHILSGSEPLFNILKSLQPGQNVAMSGYLVNVKTVDEKYHWKSAFDGYYSGPGACRIFLVEEVKLE
jgi:hypothetical protein